MRKSFWALAGLLAWLVAVPVAEAQQATWTFAPELKRLADDDSELAAGLVDVMRNESLLVGLYLNVSTDDSSQTAIGFESLSGAIHFSSDELGITDIGPIVHPLREGANWTRRMPDTTFRDSADNRLGPPATADN